MVEIFNNNDLEKENRLQRIIQKEWDMFQDVET